jgi:hypothetical protein
MNATVDPILEFRSELRCAATRHARATRRRRLIVLAVVAVATLVTSLSLAANGWILGEPAPPPVVANFETYTPQLGFHPQPGKAVLVAQDGEFKLYATTNREDTYCVLIDAPWRHPTEGDGGVCVSKAKAEEPIAAGILTSGGGGAGSSHSMTFVVGGRVNGTEARTIRFEDQDGNAVERLLGSGGFYVAAVEGTLVPIGRPIEGAPCSGRRWEPTFVALGNDGRRLNESKILLVCGGGYEVTPHGPYRNWP